MRLQVLISKDADVAGRVAENVRGLELEVSVLRELKHPNIVQYLVRSFGTRLPGTCFRAAGGLQNLSCRPITQLKLYRVVGLHHGECFNSLPR